MAEFTQKEFAPETPRAPVKAYYLMTGTGQIFWAYVKEVLEDDDKVLFTDGGWCYLSSCYFSEAQCRSAHGLIDPATKTAIHAAADIIFDAVEKMEQAKEKLLALDTEKTR